MPHPTVKAVKQAATVLLVGGLALSGCQRGTGGGGTTTIQQAPQTTSAASTSATPSVSAINDGKALCSAAIARAQQLTNATGKYWNLVLTKHSLGDQEVSDAADKVTEVSAKVLPVLDGIVGAGAPQPIANTVHEFTNNAKAFTKAIGDRAPDDEINPLANKFQDDIDALNKACGY